MKLGVEQIEKKIREADSKMAALIEILSIRDWDEREVTKWSNLVTRRGELVDASVMKGH